MKKIGFIFFKYHKRNCLFFFTGIPNEIKLRISNETLNNLFPEFKGGEIMTKTKTDVPEAIKAAFPQTDSLRLEEAIMQCGFDIPGIAAYLHRTIGEP